LDALQKRLKQKISGVNALIVNDLYETLHDKRLDTCQAGIGGKGLARFIVGTAFQAVFTRTSEAEWQIPSRTDKKIERQKHTCCLPERGFLV
jgi:hypothetical protein